MKNVRADLFTVLAFWAVTLSPSVPGTELPVETFFSNYEFTRLTLSPDGKYLAAIAPVGKSRNLVIIDMATMQPKAVTSLTHHDVAGYSWANNQRLIFYVEEDGNESLAMYAVNVDGTKPRTLTKASRGVQLVPRYTRMVDRMKEDERRILVLSNERRLMAPDLYTLDIYSGRKKRLTSNPGDISAWITDWKHRVRAAIREKVSKDGANVVTEVLYRKNESTPWKTIARYGLGEEPVSPVAFSADNRKLYLLSAQGRDRLALYLLDPETGKRQLVFGHDQVDVSNAFFSPRDNRLLAASYVTERPRLHYTDPLFGGIQKALDRALPDTFNEITSITDDEKAAIVRAWNDRTPGTWYLLKTVPKLKLEYLAQVEERIKPGQMVEMKPIRFQARDGLELHGYLTLPKQHEGKPVPLIVHPHGGPYGVRDVWGWNPEAQFLANRGYAVLQVNYRGSGGYGHRFQTDAWKQWGLQMQDDLTDAVRWAIEQGVADPGRVCIYGASYGGYATMAGLTQTPELYSCGINYVGVVDLVMLEKWDRRWDRKGTITAWFHRAIGDPDDPGDLRRMRQASPINHLDKLEDPLFVIHGRRDPRVEIKQADTLLDRLDDLNKPHVKLIKAKEGHGFRREENRLELYRMMDDFLEKNL